LLPVRKQQPANFGGITTALPEPKKTPQPKHDSQRTVPAAVIDVSDCVPSHDPVEGQGRLTMRETPTGATLAQAYKTGYAENHTSDQPAKYRISPA
jgi:hypothetical protein